MIATAAVCLPLAVLFQSCGLPGQVPTLAAPVASGDPNSTNIFTFNNGAQTSPDDFYGFEIYYKFYDNTNSNASIEYNSNASSLTAGATGPSQIQALGYRRAYLLPPGYTQGDQISQPTVPAIPITNTALRSTAFTVTISFSDAFPSAADFYPPVEINGTPLTVQVGGTSGSAALGRYFQSATVPTSAGGYIVEGFGQYDFAGDQGALNGLSPSGDIPDSIMQTVQASAYPNSAPLLLGLYAIAYGLYELSTPIYSTPTPLGYITYPNATFSSTSTP